MASKVIRYNHRSAETASSNDDAKRKVGNAALANGHKGKLHYVAVDDGTYFYLSKAQRDNDDTGARAFAVISDSRDEEPARVKNPKQIKPIKINWNKDSKKDARYAVSDGVMTHYVAEHQIYTTNGKIAPMETVARAFTIGYDHGDTEDTYAIGWIEDLTDGEHHAFAFDGHGNFEWNTRRQS